MDDQSAQEEVNLQWAVNEAQVNLDDLVPQDHTEFIQRGNHLICLCHNHQARIPADKVLNKRDGVYVLEPLVIRP